MSIHELQIKAGEEWYGSKELRRAFCTLEYYWTMKYQRIYCPSCRADFTRFAAARAGLSKH